jgi:hypothetical protein
VAAVLGVALLEWEALQRDAESLQRVASQWHDPNTRFDSELGWRPIESRQVELDWGEVRTNQQGFRSAPLRAGAQAIAVLGDSVAWGLGVDAADSFPGLLDGAFRRRNWQVSNLAVSGYGLGQSYLWLMEQRESLPVLRHVIFAICADNDVEDTSSNSRYGRRKPLYRVRNGQLRLEGVPIERHSLRHWYTDSRVVRGLLGRLPRLEAAALARMGDFRLAPDEANDVIRAVLVATRDEVAQRGGVLHAVLLPSRKNWSESTATYELLRQAVLTADVPIVEPSRMMRMLESSADSLFIDASHLTPAAHSIVSFALQLHLIRYEERTRARSQTTTTPSS